MPCANDLPATTNRMVALTGQVVLGGAGFSIYDDRDDAVTSYGRARRRGPG